VGANVLPDRPALVYGAYARCDERPSDASGADVGAEYAAETGAWTAYRDGSLVTVVAGIEVEYIWPWVDGVDTHGFVN